MWCDDVVRCVCLLFYFVRLFKILLLYRSFGLANVYAICMFNVHRISASIVIAAGNGIVSIAFAYDVSIVPYTEIHTQTQWNNVYEWSILYRSTKENGKQMLKKRCSNCMFVACIFVCTPCIKFCQLLERHVTNIFLLNYSL